MLSSPLRNSVQRVGSRLAIQSQRRFASSGRIGPSFYTHELTSRFKSVFVWAGTLSLLLGWPFSIYYYQKRKYSMPEL